MLNILERNMALIDVEFPELKALKMWSDKSSKNLVSEDPITRNMVKVLKDF